MSKLYAFYSFSFPFSPFSLSFLCLITTRPSYILCTKSAVPCRSPVRHNKVFPEKTPCSCLGENWSLPLRRVVTQHAGFSERGREGGMERWDPHHLLPTPTTQSVGSVAHNGGGDRAGWDEDSFHKVPLRQRSLPSLRAITPTVSHKEAGRFPRTPWHWGRGRSYEITALSSCRASPVGHFSKRLVT